MDLHLDGSWLQLSPFETEMRLRLWWHLCVLDSRAPEDQGLQTTVDITNRQLRLPLNVNDNQLYPDMESLPTESDGWTEMSFFLIQTASCRLLHPILDTQKQHLADPILNIVEKRKTIKAHGQVLSAKFGGVLSGSGQPTDLSRIALQHITTARKKMEFVLQLREEICMQKHKERNHDATLDVLKLSFKLAVDGLESSRVLLKGGLASRFTWFFKMYTQWYALAYILRCLSSSPESIDADRAWNLVEEMFPRGISSHEFSDNDDSEYGRGSIWRCVILLRNNAISSRRLAQLSVAADVPGQSTRRNPFCTSQHHPSTNMSTESVTTEMRAPPPHGSDQEFGNDSNGRIFSGLDFPMPEIPFLPDWNAVINGCISDYTGDIIPSYDSTYPVDGMQSWDGPHSV